jgi:serine/threonine-protein kinase
MIQTLILGRYRVVRPLGEGGMAKVYLGRQEDGGTGGGRDVVIKVMHEHLAKHPRFLQDFLRETRLMASFRHPNAVAFCDASLADDQRPCLVMEYVPGTTLEAIVAGEGRLPVARVGRLLGQLCGVLEAAHNAGILHRDLTAANILVVDAGTPTEKLKVTDFGLARAGGGPYFALGKLNGTGAIGGGTPDYVCPEQVRGDEVDHRGDIYSVGVLLFKLLTGHLPFEHAESVAEILLAHTDKEPPSFASLGVEDVPPGVEVVVRSCLAKYPHERPQTARDLGQRFGLAIGHKILAEHGVSVSSGALPVVRPRFNPVEVVDRLEAWMPESIAVCKLRGFVGDIGGEVIDSEPGLVRVHLPLPASQAQDRPTGWFGWLRGNSAAARGVAVMELHLEKKGGTGNSLTITVAMRSERSAAGNEWKAWCERVCRDLRGYLMGK